MGKTHTKQNSRFLLIFSKVDVKLSTLPLAALDFIAETEFDLISSESFGEHMLTHAITRLFSGCLE
jgi:hypothetical protein